MHDQHFRDARAELLGEAREQSATDEHVVRVADRDDRGAGHSFSNHSAICFATPSRGRRDVSIVSCESRS